MVVEAPAGTGVSPVLAVAEEQAEALVGAPGLVGVEERAGEKVSVVKELAVGWAELELVEVLVPPPTAFLFSFA